MTTNVRFGAILLGLALIGCSGHGPAKTGATGPSVSEQLAALEEVSWNSLSGTVNRTDEAIAAADELIERDATQARAYWWSAAMRTKRVSNTWKGDWSEIANASASNVEDMRVAQAHTEKASELGHGELDFRFVIPWVGLTTYLNGLLGGDTVTKDLGVQRLTDAAKASPVFAPLIIAATMGQYSDKTDPEFSAAVDLVTQAFNSPEILGCVQPNSPNSDICLNEGPVPHGAEGAFLIFGDLFVKAGNFDRARQLYTSSRDIGLKDSWQYASLADQRLGEMEQRAAFYADSDQSNDPMFGVPGQTCEECHSAP